MLSGGTPCKFTAYISSVKVERATLAIRMLLSNRYVRREHFAFHETKRFSRERDAVIYFCQRAHNDVGNSNWHLEISTARDAE